MGNCFSYSQHEDSYQESEEVPVQRTTDPNKIIFNENPDLILYANQTIYNGKMFIGSMSKQKVAWKLFNSEDLMEREAKFLRNLNHIGIIQIKVCLRYDHKYFAAYEFAQKQIEEFINYPDKKQLMIQIAAAIEYLQSKKIAHLSIAPENIFVNDQPKPTVKLTNFSNAVNLSNAKIVHIQRAINDNQNFIAPEVRMQLVVYATTDNWSLGCIYFFLWQKGATIFPMQYENQARKLAVHINKINNVSSDAVLCKDLITNMLKFKPETRITMNAVLSHPFFWSAAETLNFIVEISKMLETQGKPFVTEIFKGSKKVIGENWLTRVDENIIQELKSKRQDQSADDFNDKAGRSIVSLIRVIRNMICHALGPVAAVLMGSEKESFLKYWCDRFPNLIKHIYYAKINYENTENSNCD